MKTTLLNAPAGAPKTIRGALKSNARFITKRFLGKTIPAIALGLLVSFAADMRADKITVATTAAGECHSLFLTSDGKLWAMGNNSVGQLGDGTTTDRDTPVQVASDVIAVAAGSYHSMYITSDGRLWTMGYNISVQSNGGSITCQTTPVQVASDVTSVSAGGLHSLYVTSDGKLWAMGDNSDGQLGRNDIGMEATAPVVVFAAIDDGSPVITAQPASQTVASGQAVAFTVSATGNPAPTYQWRVSNSGGISWSDVLNVPPYSGAKTNKLTISEATIGMNEQYLCAVTNTFGVATSNVATLTVTVGGNGNGGGGSGGGAPSLWFLGALGVLFAWRARNHGTTKLKLTQ